MKKLMLCISILILCLVPFLANATPWYVDNTASCTAGTTCTGTSWATAWKSFSAITWASINPGDTVYISGGSTSKTYSETLTVGKSGTSGSRITITVGAASPSPSGHDGTVIIDGQTRSYAIYCSYSYVSLVGSTDNGVTYKMQAINGVSENGTIRIGGAYVYVDYIKVVHPLNRGIRFERATYSRIRGCDVRTGTVTSDVQTDGIYFQYGHDNTIEYNTVINGNLYSTQHIDCIQVNHSENNTIIRGNWLEHANGRGSADSQALIIRAIDGTPMTAYIYNNVMIGSSLQPYQVLMLCDNEVAGVNGAYYVWNNIIIAQHPTGWAARVWRDTTVNHYNTTVAQFKNNICVSAGNYPLVVDSSGGGATVSFPTSGVDYNLYYRTDGNASLTSVLGTVRTWAQHKAAGYDTHGLNVNPDWNTSTYRPNSTSPTIAAGVDLSAYFTTDIAGLTRAAPWDIGPYKASGPDTTKPTIFGLLPSGSLACTVNPLTVTLQASTTEPATCRVSLSDQSYTDMGAGANMTATDAGYTHQTSVPRACGYTYTYFVACSDTTGNSHTVVDNSSFSFSIAAADSTAPTLSSLLPTGSNVCTVSSPHVGSYSVTTDGPATCRYMASNTWGGEFWGAATEMATTGGTTHTQGYTLDCNGATRYVTFMCVDASGNYSAYSTSTFDYQVGPTVFSESPSTEQACVPSDPVTIEISSVTSAYATCRYHPTENFYANMTAFTTSAGTYHSSSVSNACNAAYSYNVVCADAAGNMSPAHMISYSVAAYSGGSAPVGARLIGGAKIIDGVKLQ